MKRKGITPVIAIVLLLLITVGAVGVVYTQFQSLVGNPSQELDQQKKVQNTKLTFASVYNNDTANTASDGDSINVTLRNTGSVTINMTKQFDISFSPSGSDGYLTHSIYPQTEGPNQCFAIQGGQELVEPGESYTCNTGIAWPAATETVGIEVSFRTADKSWSYTCSPSTSSALAC